MNILLCGVGGQGIVLASQILSKAAINAGLEVYCSESHGMAQRGGSVVAHVKVGKKVYSGLIPLGEGDVMIGFEPMEAIRNLPFMSEGGRAIVNTYRVPAVIRTVEPPEDDEVQRFVRDHVREAYFIDATSIAKSINPRTLNSVMLGAATAVGLPFSKSDLEKALLESVPERFHDVNIKAFEAGYTEMKKLLSSE